MSTDPEPRRPDYAQRAERKRQSEAHAEEQRRVYDGPLAALRPDWVAAWHRLDGAVEDALRARIGGKEPAREKLRELAGAIADGVRLVGAALGRHDALLDARRAAAPGRRLDEGPDGESSPRTAAAKLARADRRAVGGELRSDELISAVAALRSAIAGGDPGPGVLAVCACEEVGAVARVGQWARILAGCLDPWGGGPSGDDMAFGRDHLGTDYWRAQWLCGHGGFGRERDLFPGLLPAGPDDLPCIRIDSGECDSGGQDEAPPSRAESPPTGAVPPPMVTPADLRPDEVTIGGVTFGDFSVKQVSLVRAIADTGPAGVPLATVLAACGYGDDGAGRKSYESLRGRTQANLDNRRVNAVIGVVNGRVCLTPTGPPS